MSETDETKRPRRKMDLTVEAWDAEQRCWRPRPHEPFESMDDARRWLQTEGNTDSDVTYRVVDLKLTATVKSETKRTLVEAE